ncbi:MAG: DUF697 domain-containing protein [Thermoanaerobaculia bacterium]
MSRAWKNILAAAGILLTLYLLVILAAGISQVADAADRVKPGLGQIVFWALVILFAIVVVSPIVLYLRLPPALIPPEESSGPEYEAYLARLRRRLAPNPRLEGRDLETDEGLHAALADLAEEAERIVRNTAKTVFVSTAVMQNGRLDGAVVLATQVRMVWQVASVYHQRPSPRQLLYLYSNVGATALLAAGIEDIDFSELVTPLVVSVVPSLKGAVPGLQAMSSLLVNSLANGAANAFLTLRVGAVARQYCEATSALSRRAVRRSATAAAAAHVGRIVRENGVLVVKGTWKAVRNAAGDSLDSAVQGTRSLGAAFARKLRRSSRAALEEPAELAVPPAPGEPSSS